jgi:type VI secretion system protein ImpA
MSELADALALVETWLQPLDDESAPCGADLEYDNEFLELTQAAAGKPESQFGPAEPPDWRSVVSIAASLFERTRDLRVAVDWLRGSLRLHGYAALPVGLKLINGLIENHWDHLHPMPDPDDGDPYGRVNALTLLREHAGALGDLREARISEDRAIGILKVSDVEAVLAAPGSTVVTTELTKEQATKMLAALVEKTPELRGTCAEAVTQVKALIAAANDKLGQSVAPDLRPLYTITNGIAGLLPPEASDEEEGGEEGEGGAEGTGGGSGRARGLSGSVTTREEALKAIDLVIDFLERTEPTNPAPLFLRRARQLVGHNFLQLMKVLAPDALAEVARIVGVDPESIQDPDAEA